MNRLQSAGILLSLLLAACSSVENQGTIAQLRQRQILIAEAEISGGLDKAMASYQLFLEESQGTAMAPEAIRRLADLKVEKEYGYEKDPAGKTHATSEMTAPEPGLRQTDAAAQPPPATARAEGESEKLFEQRTTQLAKPEYKTDSDPVLDDLEKAGPLEAILLYQRLLDEYPLYQRNDQVLYQMSRAYEELGRIEEAMNIMERLVREYPQSRYFDEVQFRRAEFFFSHRKYLDAEDAYKSTINVGVSSSFYQLALYKLGWTFYKQELYEEAQHQFIALLDYKLATGYDFEQTADEPERKRIEDTFRVISLGFSYLGGADTVVDYFSRYGRRAYEDSVYRNLGEYYYTKRRYSDAVTTYGAFVTRNPFHRKSPEFQMQIIEINTAGGFPSLVIEAKKSFATSYGLKSAYWQHFEPADRPEVISYLKTNLTDLANHFHALYQSPKRVEEKPQNFTEALRWYRDFLVSFPQEQESAAINYQLADLLLENRSFGEAAVEYEKTAYAYAAHAQSDRAGYAAVYAYRQQLELSPQADNLQLKREVVRSSLQFAATFPAHEKAAVVLGAAADDLYAMGEYEQALAAAQKLIAAFPAAAANVARSAWLVIAHSSYELKAYSEAEAAYSVVLELLPKEAPSRADLTDNLAAAIYNQGAQARTNEDFAGAAEHFLRIGVKAPTSGIRPAAEYDAAAMLIQLKDWGRAATVLTGFRQLFPRHELQAEVTRKIAYVYREDGKYSQAAAEFERIETESDDEAIRREALQVAAELHLQANSELRTLAVYRRYVDSFPQPVESNIETRNKMAELLKKQQQQTEYLAELRQIVALDAAAGSQRSDRTRFLAAKASLPLAEIGYAKFLNVQLVKPFKQNLSKKQQLMKAATQEFSRLLDYEVGEVTAAATFYLAEIYAHFSSALMASERPEGLTPEDLEEYELAIEEQAYPFEERAIAVHQSNLELIALGVYNPWIEKSLARLAMFIPARYAKTEEASPLVAALDAFEYVVALPPPAPSVEREAAPPTVTEEVRDDGAQETQVSPEQSPRDEQQDIDTVATELAPDSKRE